MYDLAFLLKDLMTKLFADDTTLIDTHDNMDILITKFKKKLEILINWCKFNKLDINWAKTDFMFVTNKRIKAPKEIEISAGISVRVVEQFKLLGVTIDNKLNFETYASMIKKSVNRKLYSIKRLFYLCQSVKLQFSSITFINNSERFFFLEDMNDASSSYFYKIKSMI